MAVTHKHAGKIEQESIDMSNHGQVVVHCGGWAMQYWASDRSCGASVHTVELGYQSRAWREDRVNMTERKENISSRLALHLVRRTNSYRAASTGRKSQYCSTVPA